MFKYKKEDFASCGMERTVGIPSDIGCNDPECIDRAQKFAEENGAIAYECKHKKQIIFDGKIIYVLTDMFGEHVYRYHFCHGGTRPVSIKGFKVSYEHPNLEELDKLIKSLTQ